MAGWCQYLKVLRRWNLAAVRLFIPNMRTRPCSKARWASLNCFMVNCFLRDYMHCKQASGLSEMCQGSLCAENHCVSESFKIPLPTNWQGLWRCLSSMEKGEVGAITTLVKSWLHTYEDFWVPSPELPFDKKENQVWWCLCVIPVLRCRTRGPRTRCPASLAKLIHRPMRDAASNKVNGS